MIIGFISFIIFFFVLYVLAKDDFVFVRRNISLDEIFNAMFLGVPFVILSARIVYVIMHPKWSYINPFVFFLFPYFPGLFTGGGIIGGVLFLYLFTKKTKVPFQRLFDEIGLSFLISASCFYLFTAGVMAIGHHIGAIGDAVLSLVYFIAYILSYLMFTKDTWKDGNIGSIAILFHSVFSLLYATILIVILRKLTITPEEVFYVLLLLVSMGFLLKRQYFTKERK